VLDYRRQQNSDWTGDLSMENVKERKCSCKKLTEERRLELIEVIKSIGDRVLTIEDIGNDEGCGIKLGIKGFSDEEWDAIYYVFKNDQLDEDDLEIESRTFINAMTNFATRAIACRVDDIFKKLEDGTDDYDAVNTMRHLLQILAYANIRCMLFGGERVKAMKMISPKSADKIMAKIMFDFRLTMPIHITMSRQVNILPSQPHEQFLFNTIVACLGHGLEVIWKVKDRDVKDLLEFLTAHMLVSFANMFTEFECKSDVALSNDNKVKTTLVSVIEDGQKRREENDKKKEKGKYKGDGVPSVKELIEKGEKCKGVDPKMDKVIDQVIKFLREREGEV
jgi:hypothetical protein